MAFDRHFGVLGARSEFAMHSRKESGPEILMSGTWTAAVLNTSCDKPHLWGLPLTAWPRLPRISKPKDVIFGKRPTNRMPMECQHQQPFYMGKSLCPEKENSTMLSRLKAEVLYAQKHSKSRDAISLHDSDTAYGLHHVRCLCMAWSWMLSCFINNSFFRHWATTWERCVQYFLLKLVIKSTFSPGSQDDNQESSAKPNLRQIFPSFFSRTL